MSRIRSFGDLDIKSRPDDIYLVSFMKSGTTWMQMILYQLTSDGNMNFRHINDISPFLEFSRYRNLECLPPPRLFKTHAQYNAVPRGLHGKFIYLMRDGKDVAVSLYYHFKPFEKSWKKLTFDTCFKEKFLNVNKIKGFAVDENGWFGYMRGWLANKKKFNILYIKYEDLLADIEGNIRKISDFCGFNLEESRLPIIFERCSFTFMKKHQLKFEGRDPTGSSNIKMNDFIRKGKAIQWHSYFNEWQNKIYEERFSKFLADFQLVDCYNPKNKK